MKLNGLQSLGIIGGVQEVSIISELGLYEIILSITNKDLDRYQLAKNFKNGFLVKFYLLSEKITIM